MLLRRREAAGSEPAPVNRLVISSADSNMGSFGIPKTVALGLVLQLGCPGNVSPFLIEKLLPAVLGRSNRFVRCAPGTCSSKRRRPQGSPSLGECGFHAPEVPSDLFLFPRVLLSLM
ncbi:hypothetical protein TNCV_4390051 [Trichonephila clavipes]|nr:hypothetical protein TNCV_4390051 [Trichonephila clavipes]